jgi:SAM-dependent methyltransferase
MNSEFLLFFIMTGKFMNKHDVIEFFNGRAHTWDDCLVRIDWKISRILDLAGITEGVSVLDVACGTGVLFPDYLVRNVKSVTGIDISPVMISKATAKVSDPRIELVCADIEDADLGMLFDRCMVYNAFPHFPDPARLIRSLSEKLIFGGRLTVAHSMARARIDKCHSGSAGRVSMGLISETELAAVFEPYFDVDTVISDDEMYAVSGVKRREIK